MAELRVFRSRSFKIWYDQLSEKMKRVADARVDTAKFFGVLSKYKQLDRKISLYEFKWESGMRVYFSLLSDNHGEFILLLVGGNKKFTIQRYFEGKKYNKKGNRKYRR